MDWDEDDANLSFDEILEILEEYLVDSIEDEVEELDFND
jgi:hypothetical protein